MERPPFRTFRKRKYGFLCSEWITESKLDDTIPVSQFHIDGFSKPYCLNINRNGSGVVIYLREDIPSNILTKHVLLTDIEALCIELNFRKCEW